ncbi:hypothetical protein ABFX02_04G140500 [Erythranthe guttata]
MAAYASLVSLLNIMDQIQNHPRLSICLHQEQAQSLCEKIDFLLHFIQSTHSHGGSKEVEVLESQIARAAYAAEDIIESHIVDQLAAGSTSFLDLQKIIADMDSVNVNKEEIKDLKPTSYPTTSSQQPLTSNTEKCTMVGFDEESFQLKDALTGQQSGLQIIPIVGMGGSGKTTLVKNVYDSSLIFHHFDIIAWATISQNYTVREIFSQLFSCQSKSTGDHLNIPEADEHQLTHKFYQNLIGRRYLIVLDDMWSTDAWDRINFFFPDNTNKSRIVVTTRLSSVATYFGSSSYLSMKFLNEDISWNLFCKKTFAQLEGCPPELEEIAKKIVRKCRGLPLSIVVIGGLLRKSYKTKEYWEDVAREKNSIINLGDDQQSFDILSLSYSHLPAHLKPCFLYTGVFPEDHRIHVTQLIKLWVAEGFIRPNNSQSLEEIAEDYLKDLTDRNLILVHRYRSTGKIKICLVHDLLRDLCLKKAQEEKFLRVMGVSDIPQGIDEERRVVFHEKIPEDKYDDPRVFSHGLESASLARSLVSNGGRMSFKFRLLRVLLNVVDSKSRDDIFKLFNLRYACKSYSSESRTTSVGLPSSISLLWNVQTLIIRGNVRFVAPSEIWSMQQLRHLDFAKISFRDPPLSDQQDNHHDSVLRNLQTLKGAVNLRLSEEVCERIPNVKKLKIMYFGISRSSRDYCLYNIGRLQKLESLNCCVYESQKSSDEQTSLLRRDLVRNTIVFPRSLVKLTLEGCFLHWEDLTRIGSLPHLQVLKLINDSVVGSEWNPVEGEFLKLKFLKIVNCNDLVHWNADSSHFPVLENLFVIGLKKLDEIPLAIGDIPTLRNILLNGCSESAVISVLNIGEDQQSLGNEILTIRILNKKKELTSEELKEKFQVFTDEVRERHFPL